MEISSLVLIQENIKVGYNNKRWHEIRQWDFEFGQFNLFMTTENRAKP